MIVRSPEDMPPLSYFPKETQELVMRILIKAAKRRMQCEKDAASAQSTATSEVAHEASTQ